MRRYFISTTIPYVNAKPHLGHLLEFVQTDSFARFHRQQGEDVFFLTGSDENSLKNVLAAEAEGISTKALVDRNVEYFTELRDPLALSYDRFIRTSADPEHALGATKLWQRLAEAGAIYRKDYRGLYCVGCEQFYAPEELVDGRCPEHGTVPELIEENNYFFRLSDYQDRLLDEIRSNRMQIIPQTRRNEVLRFIEGGLDDFSISRTASRARGWGIPVPDDDSQVMYVWVDALTNYITALDYAGEGELYGRYWVGADDRVHTLGKGVTRFHAVYWPAMLLAAGIPLPTTIFVHGYITLSGAKLSKSGSSGRDPAELLGRYGSDALRYFLLREVPATGDSDFDEDRLVQLYNSDLANALGNLLNRVATMVENYRDGLVRQPRTETEPLRMVPGIDDRVREALADYDPRAALGAIWELVRETNVFLSQTEPWALAQSTDTEAQDSLDESLGSAALAISHIGRLLGPLLPGTAAAIGEQIVVEPGMVRAQRGPTLFPRLTQAEPAP